MESNMWVQIEDFPDYFINELGQVASVKGKSWKELKLTKDGHGYVTISLWKDEKRFSKKVHRLVMEIFNRKSELHIDHINGVKTDNRLENLEYVSQKENNQRAWKNGLCENVRKAQLKLFGENNGNSKLTEVQVLEIISLKGKISQRKIAEKFNIHFSLVSRIYKGKTWKYLQKK